MISQLDLFNAIVSGVPILPLIFSEETSAANLFNNDISPRFKFDFRWLLPRKAAWWIAVHPSCPWIVGSAECSNNRLDIASCPLSIDLKIELI